MLMVNRKVAVQGENTIMRISLMERFPVVAGKVNPMKEITLYTTTCKRYMQKANLMLLIMMQKVITNSLNSPLPAEI